jgi:DNA-binding SARP family transcriptional activator/Tfp pilus assembly protein PilF
MLHLHTLGRFELVRPAASGIEVISVQPKRLALLAYLCISAAAPRGLQRRDTLLALFWPESSEEEARRALRQALYYLRNALGDGVLLSRPDESLEVVPGALWCDAVALETAAGTGRPAEALDLYGGDFLAGVHLPQVSAELEQWMDATRARLRRVAATAAWSVAQQAGAGGATAKAVAAARRAVELQPDDEAGARRLIELLQLGGDRLSALSAYENLVRRFQQDFGAAPSPETTALGARLRAAAPVPVPPQTEDGSAPHELVAPSTSGAAARPRRWAAWFAAAAVVGVMAGLALRARAGEGAPAGGEPVVRSDRLLVADLANHTRDSLLAGAIGEALRVDLAQSRLVGVLSSQQVSEALARMEQSGAATLTDSLAREIALREGIGVYVTGAVGSIGRGYVVSAELVSAGEGEVLATVRETAADSTRLLQAVDRVGSVLRERLGESVGSVRATPPLERVTTRSLDALRRYSGAVRASVWEGDNRRAYRFLREAVELDSGFAMAWRLLAWVAGNLGEHGTARLASEQAFRHRERLPDRDRLDLAASYYAYHARQADAIRAYGALLDAYPKHLTATFNISWLYFQLHDWRRAEEYNRRALALDSTIPKYHWTLAVCLLAQGKLEAAAAQTRKTLERFPALERALWLDVDIAMARWDLPTADRRTRELLAESPDNYARQDRGLRTLATLALMRGRVRDAERYLLELEPVLRREGSPSERVMLAAWRGFVEAWYRGSGDRAAAVMEGSLADLRLDSIPVGDRHNRWRGYVYALAGRQDRVRALVAEARAAPPDGIGREGELLRVEGAAQLAEGRVTDAIATLRRSAEIQYCPLCALPDLARTYERAGQPDSAIAVYQRYLRTPWMDRWSSDGEFTGHALLRIAELSDQRGDVQGAAAAYRKFVELWRRADAELQPLVKRAEDRLAALDNVAALSGSGGAAVLVAQSR